MLDKILGLWPFSPLIFLVCFIAMCTVIRWYCRKAEPIKHEGRCHWCNENVSLLDRAFKKCPNCGGIHMFHREHGVGWGATSESLDRLQPRCRGIYVGGHPNGHVKSIDIRHLDLCARCYLENTYWDNWWCSAGVRELNAKHVALNNAAKLPSSPPPHAIQ